MDRPTDPALPPEIAGAGDGAGPTASGPAYSDAAAVAADDARRQAQASTALWTAAARLVRRRWVILGLTAVAAVLSVVLTLRMDNWYGATARLLPPENDSGGGLSSLIGDLSPIASSVLGSGGGGGGNYQRYLSIVTSRSMLDAVVERFDLVTVYDLADEEYPEAKARGQLLENNLDYEVDLEFEFLSITAYDKDPRRAAQMTNFIVEELNRRNEQLAVENARRYREFVETRYAEVEQAMEDARSDMQAFQERNGVVELPTTAQAFVEALAEARSQVAIAEVQYEATAALGGPESPDVVASRAALDAARRAQAELEGGGESFMPVPLRRLPAVANEYAALYQELVIQQTLLETARPLYEQARFDEERERVAVQVLDEAVPPTKKARPRRSLIVIGVTISTFVLACLLVLGVGWLRANRARIAANLRAAA